MYLHCIWSLHKVYRCSQAVGKKKLQTHSLAQLSSITQLGAVVPKTDGVKHILPPNLLELECIAKFIIFQMLGRCLTRWCNRGSRLKGSVPSPSTHTRSFPLNAMLSTRIPGQFRSGFSTEKLGQDTTCSEHTGVWDCRWRLNILTQAGHNKLETLSSETNQNCSGIRC